MNLLLTIGLLLIVGYIAGWLVEKIGLPKIIGYVATGIAFSPNTNGFVDHDISLSTQPLMEVCLAFIAFEVGGALKLSKIREHGKEIVRIAILASIIPFILIVSGILALGTFFPSTLPLDNLTLLIFALLLGTLASPTSPAATLAVMHGYKAKGKVSDTIMGVAALDDALGILLFSLTIGMISLLDGSQDTLQGYENAILHSLYQVVGAIIVGIALAIVMDRIARLFELKEEGQWIIVISALLILCPGIAKSLNVDILLSCMTMGVFVVNRSNQQKVIFRILERYTEGLVILIFFLLSGLHLDISTIPQATILIITFVLLRTAGKYMGVSIGARMAKADPLIRRYTAGGLLPQAGIVIGLVLSIYQKEGFEEISEILLTTIMGASIIHELIGPLAAKRSLLNAGEINPEELHKT